MTPVIFGPDDPLNGMVGDFVSYLNIGRTDAFEKYCSLGIFHDGCLEAGVVYHNWYPDTGAIELSAASSSARWLTRQVIRSIASVAFEALKARIVVLRVSEHNSDMRSIAQRVGFRETIIPQMRGSHEAECVYTLTADAWAKNRLNR